MKILKTKKYSILSSILKYSFVMIFAVMIVMPFVLNAAPGTVGGGDGPGVVGGTNINTKINNPLGEGKLDTIPKFITALVEIVVYVGIPIVALAIIYTGFLFVMAQGNSEKITKAKSALMYTLIGAALLLGAFVIAKAIGTTVEDIKKGV